MKKIIAALFITMSLTGCDNFPHHTVYQNSTTMVIYKVSIENDTKYGKYKYAINDETDKGWTYITSTKFQAGDTLYITNKKPQ